MSVSNVPQGGTPEGARASGRGYWFTPLPVYLLDAVYDPDSPVNAPAAMLWAHIHRHYAWRERVFPSYARLAEETKQSESAVKRQLNALKTAGAITWGATYRTRGRSSNEYALAVIEPFRFDRETPQPVQVKNDLHSSVQVKNDLLVQVESDPHPQVKNGPGVKSSSDFESTDDLSLPSVPTQRTEPAPVAEERETFAPPNNKPTTPAAAPADAADRIIDAYTTILGRPVLTRTRSALRHQAAEALKAGYPEEWLTDRARELAAHGWTDLAKHVEKSLVPLPGAAPSTAPHAGGPSPWCGQCGSGYGTAAQFNVRFRRRDDGTPCHCHPDAARNPLPGTDTTVSGWYALAEQLRQEGDPSTTDQRVQAALDLGRQMQAEYNARHTGYLPRPQPTPEERAADLGHF